MNSVPSRIQGCLLGVAIGDALGMPVETMSHDRIMEATKGIGIDRFIEPINRRDWTKGMKAGATTDDWQLTRAVLTSLIRTQGVFSVADCAAEHVRESSQSLFGWGKTTQGAIDAIKRGERDPEKDPLPPAPVGGGCGNGIVMKVAPVAIANFLRQKDHKDLWRDVKTLGSITHPDILASVSAFAVAVMLCKVLQPGILSAGQVGFLFEQMLAVVINLEKEEKIPPHVSNRLLKIPDFWNDAGYLRKGVGCGFYAIDTAAFAIGTFLRHTNSFRQGVLEAVNAGGDTDTNASVVGALIGANVGLEGIPDEWKCFSEEFKEPQVLGHQLSLITA
ncbi:MAG: ADP-ribosylglycohydrolase family protein [Patescibacteria group bacterium]